MNFKLLALFVIANILMVMHSKAHENELAIIRTIAPQSENDTVHKYFTSLIQLALNKSEEKFGPSQLVLSTTTLNQGRWLRLLEQNLYIDIAWGGASTQREEDLIAIPIDLLGGILGVRTLIIRREDRQRFNKIKDMDSLRQLIACQAKHWPDTKILENAGFNVAKTSRFEANFQMLERKRCDFFPRGIHEAYSEIAKYQVMWGDKLALYDDLFIIYPFNMWLYVNKANAILAERINYGMVSAIDDGSLKKLLENHPVTSHLFPLSHWQGKRLFFIDNPLQEIRTTNEAWWLLRDFPFYSQIPYFEH